MTGPEVRVNTRTREQEMERLDALIERNANWLIQGRAGDADYIRSYIRQLEAQRDALRKEGA